jgi:hypothetical protein
MEDDFSFAKDGSTAQKLDILENMMRLKMNATMIGDFTGRGLKLFFEKAAGNVCGCIGFVKDRNTRLTEKESCLAPPEILENNYWMKYHRIKAIEIQSGKC